MSSIETCHQIQIVEKCVESLLKYEESSLDVGKI